MKKSIFLKKQISVSYTHLDVYKRQVYVDGSENVYTVAQKLSDMGYYVDNESIDSEAINRGIVSLMNVFYYGSFIISAIIVIYAASILFVQRKQNARINEYFKQLGLSEFDILKIRKHYYLLNEMCIRDSM